jgi:hypothetical protein
MDLQWNEKRRRSTSSRSSLAWSEEKQLKVYHRSIVQERDAARRQAIREKKEEEVDEA